MTSVRVILPSACFGLVASLQQKQPQQQTELSGITNSFGKYKHLGRLEEETANASWERNNFEQLEDHFGSHHIASVKNSPDEWLANCSKILPYVTQLGASTASTHSPKNAVFIELDRITEPMLEAFELLVHNALILLEPDRMHTLVAGNRGFTIMQKLNSRISVDLTIFCYLAEFSSADEYNNFFKYDFFRRQFSRKHLLMYQGDTIILRGGTEEFLQYDCAGAPWPCRDPDDNHCVGDGGFIVTSCMKKANAKEIQINGGSVDQKVDFTTEFFEQEAKVSDIFAQNKMIDVIGATKGKGLAGVIARWGYTSLSRMTHRGLRTVACIGTWRPARVQFQLPRSGQNGFHLHTEINGKICFVSKAVKDEPNGIMTKADLTEKSITPIGSFLHYGEVTQDWIMLKGGITEYNNLLITWRKSFLPQVSRKTEKNQTLSDLLNALEFNHVVVFREIRTRPKERVERRKLTSLFPDTHKKKKNERVQRRQLGTQNFLRFLPQWRVSTYQVLFAQRAGRDNWHMTEEGGVKGIPPFSSNFRLRYMFHICGPTAPAGDRSFVLCLNMHI